MPRSQRAGDSNQSLQLPSGISCPFVFLTAPGRDLVVVRVISLIVNRSVLLGIITELVRPFAFSCTYSHVCPESVCNGNVVQIRRSV